MPNFIFDNNLIEGDTNLSDSVLDDLLKDNFSPTEIDSIKQSFKDYSYKVAGVESSYGENPHTNKSTAQGRFQFLTGKRVSSQQQEIEERDLRIVLLLMRKI